MFFFVHCHLSSKHQNKAFDENITVYVIGGYGEYHHTENKTPPPHTHTHTHTYPPPPTHTHTRTKPLPSHPSSPEQSRPACLPSSDSTSRRPPPCVRRLSPSVSPSPSARRNLDRGQGPRARGQGRRTLGKGIVQARVGGKCVCVCVISRFVSLFPSLMITSASTKQQLVSQGHYCFSVLVLICDNRHSNHVQREWL